MLKTMGTLVPECTRPCPLINNAGSFPGIVVLDLERSQVQGWGRIGSHIQGPLVVMYIRWMFQICIMGALNLNIYKNKLTYFNLFKFYLEPQTTSLNGSKK